MLDRGQKGEIRSSGDVWFAEKSFKITVYSEDSGYGLLRHVLIRRGFASGQILVVLVTVSPIFPSKNNFVKALRKIHQITSIVLNVNDKDTSMVLGERNIPIYGKGYIEDSLCGCVFRISPSSFYQVNPVQTERIYQKAIDLAEKAGTESIGCLLWYRRHWSYCSTSCQRKFLVWS